MYPLSTNMKIAIKENLKVGENTHTCELRVYNQYMNTGAPFIIKNLTSISLDRRDDSASHELSFAIENEDGRYSGDYDPKKFPYLDLQRSGYQRVFYPNNKVELYLGYGDENIIQFTGTIDKISVNAENAQLEVTCRDNMKYLIDQIIIPDDARYLNYPKNSEQAWLAVDIVADLITMAGCVVEKENMDENYVIPEITFKLGDKYIDAIKKITDAVGYRVYCTRYGSIRVEKNVYPSQSVMPDFELFDYVNLTGASYVIDDQEARNRIIIAGSNSWEEFHNAGFDLWFDPKFPRMAKIDIPWANTPEKRKIAAQNAFAIMHRKTRKISVAATGHPGLEIGDIALLRDTVTTASMKYRVCAIKTNFDASDFYDNIDLEHLVDAANVDAVPTGRFFGDAVVNWAPDGLTVQDREVKIVPFDLLGTMQNEASIRVMSKDGAYLGCTIRMVMDALESITVTSDFDFNAIMNDVNKLHEKGIPDVATALALKNSVFDAFGGKLLYISAGATPNESSYIAIIGATLHTKTYKNDTIQLKFLNITSLCGKTPLSRTIGWRIKMITF